VIGEQLRSICGMILTGEFVLIMKANEMHYFSYLFDKVLYMFRACPLSVIRSLNTVFTAIGICHSEILKVGKIISVYTCTLWLRGWQQTIPEDSEYTTDSKSHTQPVQHFIRKFSDPHIYLKLLLKDSVAKII
jgi:hypothetical protein